MVASSGRPPTMKSTPIYTPENKEIITFLVIMARIIANIGGTNDKNPICSIRFPPENIANMYIYLMVIIFIHNLVVNIDFKF